MHKYTKNLIGQKFTRLTVIAEGERITNSVYWLCKCDCGNEKNVKSYYLTSRRYKILRMFK